MKKQPIESGYASLGDLNMYYEVYGKGGIPLVLIHGGGSTMHTTFGNVIEPLASDRMVIGVDLQAHGHTGDRGKATSFEQDADDVAGVLKHLKIDKADFFGFSNGGTTSMQIAIRHPQLVNKLVIASAIFKREGMFAGFFDAMKHATLDQMPRPLQDAYRAINPDPAALQTMFERDRDRMIGFKDVPEEMLKGIRARALVLQGDKDVTTREHAVLISRLIPNAELLIVPGSHGSFINEICSVNFKSRIPEATIGVIKEFLDSAKPIAAV
ncbi:MAG: alpha/beta hydrolase [Bacteroidetes bacterium]|nr:alpha/beta hydrolase [Bacteroidota bacterium]